MGYSALRSRSVNLVVGLACIVAPGAGAQPLTDPAILWNDATLYRDAYGTPHIQAGSVRSMAFAFGYAQAEDHLEPMLMAYRVALGRAAEVGGESFAESDAFALKIANVQVATAALAAADTVTRDLCEGFALGINTWILEHRDAVPAWSEGVQPIDVLAYWHYLMVTSAPFDLPGVYHPRPPLERANAWALAPENTHEGKTLLVMSPHQFYDGPYRWYEAHLMIGDVNWAGATLFGVPVLMMGHNEHLGWSLTPNLADTADFFREEIGAPAQAPNDPRFTAAAIDDIAPLLSFMSAAKPFYVRTSAGLVERAVPSVIGTRGPIFEGGGGALYSWANGAFNQFGGLRQLLLMGRATTLPEFQQALSQQQLPCFQIVYADGQGNLFYAYNARLGNKNAAVGAEDREPLNWNLPVDAGRHRFAWNEIVPPAKLPHFQNPQSGYVHACGTPPWLATTKSGINPVDWPGWLVPEQASYRGFRVNQILSAGRYSFSDMQAMLFDTVVPAAVDMVPLLLAMAEARPDLVQNAHPDLRTALRLLQDWNLQADTNSPAVAYYNIWWALMIKRHADEFENETGLYRGLLANTPAAQAYALDAAVEAARIMRNDFNSLAIPWGNLHRIHRGNRNEPIFGTGTGDSIFLADNQTFINRQWHTNFGYGFAMAVQFGEQTRAASIVPFGASENADSAHYHDQMDLFLSRQMKPTRFQYDQVIAHAASGYGTRVVLGSPGLDGFCAIALEQPARAELEQIAMPPRPFPGGQVPFTPAIRPAFANGAPPHTWELELYVPEEKCAPDALSRLRIYTYTPQEGWTPLPAQRLDRTHDVFTGAGAGSVIIAVFGPHDLLLEPQTDTATAPELIAGTATPEDVRRAPLVPATAEITPAAPDEAPVAGAPVAGTAPETAPEIVAPPKNRLFDLEIMGGAAAGGNAPLVPAEETEPDFDEKKKRGKEKVGNAPVIRQNNSRGPRKNFSGQS